MSKPNPWQLYSTVPGWEAVSERLEQAYKRLAIINFVQVQYEVMTREEAAGIIRRAMLVLMKRSGLYEFGADDTEAHDELRRRLYDDFGERT